MNGGPAVELPEGAATAVEAVAAGAAANNARTETAPANGSEPSTEQTGSSAEDEKIVAYCALEFPDFSFYVKTLSVTIGRRPPVEEITGEVETLSNMPLSATSAALSRARPPLSHLSPKLGPITSNTRSTSPSNFEEEPYSGTALTVAPASIVRNSGLPEPMESPQISVPPLRPPQEPIAVDLDLGQIKAVSRDHARLFYDKATTAWRLEVRGRNGVVVDGRWRAKGEMITMNRRTRIQIAERIFHFSMPANVAYNPTFVDSGSASDSNSSQWSSDGEVSVSSDDLESAISDLPPTVPLLLSQGQPRLKLYISRPKPEPYVQPRVSSRPRRPPPKKDEPIEVKIPKPPTKKAAKKKDVEPPPLETGQAPPNAVAGPSTAEPGDHPPAQPAVQSRPLAPNGEINEHVGKVDKPPYSFAALVAQAIHHCHPKKLSSAAICEWVAAHYPWFAINKEKVAWQNSIQQNLTVHTIFLKSPRGADEPGKGNFWLMDDKLKHTFDGVNFSVQPTKRNSGYGGAGRAAGQVKGAAQPRKKAAKAAPPVQPSGLPKSVAASPAIRQVASTSASTLTPINVTAVLPVAIKVGPIPPDYIPPKPTAPTMAQGEVALELAREPPIVMYHGTLILNPAIFSHLKQEQLDELSKLGASKAIGALQGDIVTYYKEKMRKMAAAKQEANPTVTAEAAATREAESNKQASTSTPNAGPVVAKQPADASINATAKRKADESPEHAPAKRQAVEAATSAKTVVPAAAASVAPQASVPAAVPPIKPPSSVV